MANPFFRYSFLIAFLCCAKLCFSQKTDLLTSAKSQEKIYIHYDKTNYRLGDTLWFKAYLFTSPINAKSSKNLYLELFDGRGKLITRLTAPIVESTAYGSIVLPIDKDIKGLYCRAYTTGMLAGDTSLIYIKPISIIELKKRTETPMHRSLNIRFLPEGGDWVNGIPALIAFKVADANGMPANATGFIKANGKTITEFSTSHEGMGAFAILPRDNEEYIAVWKEANGTEHNTALPSRKLQGIGMHITDVKDGKKFFIIRSAQANEDDKILLLVASINNTIVYKAKIDLSNHEGTNGLIPVKDLPSGILHITVFNKVLKPIAERITFVNNQNYSFDAHVDTVVINKNKRRLNRFMLTINDTLKSNISLSVTDADLETHHIYEDNIISHLLLTDDLRGKIVNPYYYFINRSDSVTRNLDLVMLTHGWRKYDWESTALKQTPEPVIENNFLAINGKFNDVSYFSKLKEPSVNIIFQTANSNMMLLPLNISQTGKFFKDGLIFYGDAKLYFKFNDKYLMSRKLQFSVNNGLIDSLQIPDLNFNPEIINDFTTSTLPSSATLSYLTKRGTVTLKEVGIKDRPLTENEKIDNTYTSGLFSGGISTNFNIGNDPRALNNISLFQYLLGKVPGLEIRNATSIDPTVVWRNEIPVKFYLNNFESSTYDVRNIPMTEFDYVKVYDPSMGGAFKAYGGVIAVYTKKGKGFEFSNKNNQSTTLSGYTPIREFYSPDYATAIKTSSPDIRTTLYWNPNIIMDKNTRKFGFQFYNNDFTRAFKMVLEGVDADGKLVHLEKVF